MKKLTLRENINRDKNLIFENFQLFAYPSTVDMSEIDNGDICIYCCDELDKDRIERELFRNGCFVCADYDNDLKLNISADDLCSVSNDLCYSPEDTYYYVACDDCDGVVNNVEFDNFGDAYDYTLDSMCGDNCRLCLYDTNDNKYVTAVYRPIHPVEQDECENRPYWDVQINESLIIDEDINPNFDKEKYGKYFDENGILIPELADEYFDIVSFDDDSELEESKKFRKYKFQIYDSRNGSLVTESPFEYDSEKEAKDASKSAFNLKQDTRRFKINVVATEDEDVAEMSKFEGLENNSARHEDATEQLGRYLRSTKEKLEKLGLFEVSAVKELKDDSGRRLGFSIIIKNKNNDNSIILTANIAKRFTQDVQQYVTITFLKTADGVNKSRIITDVLGVNYRKDSGDWVIPYAPAYNKLVKALIMTLYEKDLVDKCIENVESFGINLNENLDEDYTDVFHNWGIPYTVKECTKDLMEITHNLTDESGEFVCRHEEWRNMCVQILRKHYKKVDSREVKRFNNDKSAWKISYYNPYEI